MGLLRVGGSGARPRRIVDRDVTTGLRPCGAPNVARHSEVRPYPDGGFHTPYCAAGAARLRDHRERDGRRARRRARARDGSVGARFGLFRQLGALVRGPDGPGRGHPRCGRGVVLARPPRPPEPGVAPAVPRRPHPVARPRRRPDRPRAHPRRVPGRGAARPDMGADLRPRAGAVHRRRGSGRGVADRRRWPPRGEPERRAGSRVGAPGEAGDPPLPAVVPAAPERLRRRRHDQLRRRGRRARSRAWPRCARRAASRSVPTSPA